MPSITSNALVVAADFTAGSKAVGAAAHKVVVHHAMLLQTQVKANASGRPGPRAPTGDYRRGISRRTMPAGLGGTTAFVGTNSPQGRRLEFGFTGVDSLGRFYDQPPFPHFGPALDAIEPKFIKALSKAVDAALPGAWAGGDLF